MFSEVTLPIFVFFFEVLSCYDVSMAVFVVIFVAYDSFSRRSGMYSHRHLPVLSAVPTGGT